MVAGTRDSFQMRSQAHYPYPSDKLYQFTGRERVRLADNSAYPLELGPFLPLCPDPASCGWSFVLPSVMRLDDASRLLSYEDCTAGRFLGIFKEFSTNTKSIDIEGAGGHTRSLI